MYLVWARGPQSGAKTVAGLDDVCDRQIAKLSSFGMFSLNIVAWKRKNQGLLAVK